MDFVVKKFGLDRAQLQQLIASPNKKHTDYPNRNDFIEGLSGLRGYLRKRAKSV